MKKRTTQHKKRAKKTVASKSTKKEATKKLIVSSIAVGAVGILGYFGWQYLQKKKAGAKNNFSSEIIEPSTAMILPTRIATEEPSVISPASAINMSSAVKPKLSKSDFPLKKGSKGEKVKQLQLALQSKYGAEILPKYGADGDFGLETVNALKQAGLPNTISESLFNVLTSDNTAGSDAASIGKALYDATIKRNYNAVITLLKKLQSTSDYTAASEEYKKQRINGVRQTIVNGLLSTFTNTKQKEAIKLEFLRMGLQFDGKKWSLSGLDGLPLVTTIPTTVWTSATEGVEVPARMVLGNEVIKKTDYTLFENNGKYFLVPTKSIAYL